MLHTYTGVFAIDGYTAGTAEISSTDGSIDFKVGDGKSVRLTVGSDTPFDLPEICSKVAENAATLDNRQYDSSVTLTAVDGTVSWALAKFDASDAPKLSMTLQCGADTYSLETLFETKGAVAYIVSSGAGDGMFWEYITFNVASFGQDKLLQVAVDSQNLPSTCSSYALKYTLTSITGGVVAAPSLLGVTWTKVELHPLDSSAAVDGLNIAQTALLTKQTDLVTELGDTKDLLQTANDKIATMKMDYTALSTLVNSLTVTLDNITGCHKLGQILTPEGTCKHIVPVCDSTVNGIDLVYNGNPVPGTVAQAFCSSGFYDASGGTTCLQNTTWSPIVKNCAKCNAICDECSSFDVCTKCPSNNPKLVDGTCTGKGLTKSSPLSSCSEGVALGYESGTYWLSSASGRVYQSFCFNTVSNLGWSETYGGGWEIVHTQIGGNNLPTNPIGNAALRASVKVDVVQPPKIAAGNELTHKSQMSESYAERAAEKNMQWSKFMAKIYDGTLRGQDQIQLTFQSDSSLDWILNRYKSITQPTCATMPGKVAVEINGVSVGSTDQAYYFSTNSMGFANKQHDQCGQDADNYIDSNGVTFLRRLDTGALTDNVFRHLLSYPEKGGGRDASRCNYCCWGCDGWYEVIMWGVRKTPA